MEIKENIVVMENMKIVVRNGVSNYRLPPGFRFQPTDEELVFQYLRCKVFSSHLPASFIPHLNVCNYDPWDLPGKWNDGEERYYFSRKEAKYRNGNNRMKRTTNSGYWKATGSDRKIIRVINDNNGIAGIRKTLVFCQGKSPNASPTHWLMHEYRLLSTLQTNNQRYVKEIGDWVVCRIFMKKKKSIESDDNNSTHHHHHMLKNNNKINNNNNNNTVMNNNDVVIVDVAKPRFFDFMRVHNYSLDSGPIHYSSTSSSSSTCSSYITEVSSLDIEETSK